jgi:tRNA (guanine37-N1)-methyltransferase
MKKPLIRFDILTIFPSAFSYLNTSILKKAQDKNLIEIKIWNLRDFAFDKRKKVDDRPFGGGPGMVLKIEPIYYALEKIKKDYRTRKRKIILTDLKGIKFNQKLAQKLSKEKNLIIICGHYEGVDERVNKLVDLKISVGPYILTGGELPAMIIVDAVSRFIPGVLHNIDSLEKIENNKILSYPVYTRPRIFITKDKKKLKVPEVLISGNHKKIEEWKKKHKKEIDLS